jgi:hypothetical protein
MSAKKKVLTKEEQNQAASDAFMKEPAGRAESRTALLSNYKAAYEHFDAQGLTGPSEYDDRARKSSNFEMSNDFQLTLNELLPAKELAEVLEGWSRNEFNLWEARDKKAIERNLEGSGRNVDDYMGQNRADVTEPTATVSRVIFVDNNVSVEDQPERMKVTRELSVRFDRVPEKQQATIRKAISDLGLDSDKVLKSMEPAHRFTDGVPRLKVMTSMISSERYQFQGVYQTPNGRQDVSVDWGRQLDRAATDDEILKHASTPGPNGDLPTVMNNQFMQSYRERYGSDTEPAKAPTIHSVLTAAEGQYSQDELALVRRESSNAVKAQLAGLERHARENVSVAAINVMAARSLGVDDVLAPYRRQRDDREPQDRKPQGQVRVDRYGDAAVKARHGLTVDLGSLPDMSNPVIFERTRPKTRSAPGARAQHTVVPIPPEHAEDVKQWREHRTRIFNRRSARRTGKGRGME